MALRPAKSHCCCLRFMLPARCSLPGNGIFLLARLGIPRLVMAQSIVSKNEYQLLPFVLQMLWYSTSNHWWGSPPLICTFDSFYVRHLYYTTVSVYICYWFIVWICTTPSTRHVSASTETAQTEGRCMQPWSWGGAGRATCNKGCVAGFDVLVPWKPIWLWNELLLEVLNGFFFGWIASWTRTCPLRLRACRTSPGSKGHFAVPPTRFGPCWVGKRIGKGLLI